MAIQNSLTGAVTIFQERRLPVSATPAGYAALIGGFGLRVPLPRTLSAVADRSIRMEEGGWRIFPPRYAPDATLEDHLIFALKYEGLDLTVLKRLFGATGPGPVNPSLTGFGGILGYLGTGTALTH